MATSPPPISPFTGLAPQRKDKTTFSDRFDAFVTWIIAFVSQMAALSQNIYNNALEAFQSATAATNAAAAAMATANVTLWASGVTIPQYASVISPANGRTYRRKTASGSGTVDPSDDRTNYEPLSVLPQALVALASVTVTTSVAQIDFLNLFSDDYDKYIIEVQGMTCSTTNSDFPRMRLAVAGVVDSSSSYLGMTSPGNTPSTSDAFGLLSTLAPWSGNVYADLTTTIEIHNARSTTRAKAVSIRGASHAQPCFGTGRFGVLNRVSGFRLYLQSGSNIDAGTVRVYGVKNSLG